jgi:hypothetical protein
MLHALKDWFGGKHASRAVGKRAAHTERRARLGVECLETRELLTTAVPGLITVGPIHPTGPSLVSNYLLSPVAPGLGLAGNGDLYNTAGPGLPQLIDTAVQSLTVANNRIYDLHTNGTLDVLNSNGSGLQVLAPSVSQFAVDGTGSVVALEKDGSLVHFAPGSTVPESMGFAVTTSIRSGGLAVSIGSQTSPSTALTSAAFKVSSFLLDGAGSVVALTFGGSLVRFAPGSPSGQQMTGTFDSFAKDGSGSVVALDSGKQLWLFAPGSMTRQLMAGGVSKFAIDYSGSAVALEDGGNLMHFAPGSTRPQWTLPSIQSFGIRSDGLIYALHANNDLSLESLTGQLLVDFGVVQNFTLSGDGSCYFLQNGNLIRNTAGGNITIASVKSFGFRSDGLIYVWHTNGDLILVNSSAQQLVDFGVVQDFKLASDGSGYFLQNGNLSRNTPTVMRSIAGVQSFTLVNGDEVVYLSSLSTTNGYAPGYSAQYLQTGSAVTIYGSGFGPGIRVQFGNSGITATPIAIDSKGTWLTVYVPRYAASGPLSLILPDGTVLQSTQTFTVHDYINTYGFSFNNFNFNVSWGMIKGEFGGDQADITVGIPFTHLQVDTGVPSPFALAYWGVAAAALNGKGACFGMALTSDLLAARGQTVYNLPANASLMTTIEQNHLAQMSAEMIHYAASWVVGHSAQGIYSQLSAFLAAGDHPIITLGSGADHAVVAYDLEPGPKGNGDYYIDVYDPNRPANPTNDSAQEMASRIYIDPSRGWSFQMAGGQTYSGGYGPFSMMVVPSSVLSGSLTMPTTLEGLATIIFGSSACSTPAGTALASESHAIFLSAPGSVSAMEQTEELRRPSNLVLSLESKPTPVHTAEQQIRSSKAGRSERLEDEGYGMGLGSIVYGELVSATPTN